MISFERIGYYGRLGNQMFQYAALVGFATYSEKEWGIPERNSKEIEIGGLGYKERFVLDDLFELSYKKTNVNPGLRFPESGKLVKLPDNTDIHGYFQNSEYFSHCIEEIQKQFTFKEDIIKNADECMKEYDIENLVSVHVRRGDYTNLSDYHPPLTKEYYETAMSHFPDKKFLFISDDINWCKETFGSDFYYSNSVDMYTDLCMMSKCNSHIIANSSFSWWGAWLGGGETIAPKKWFGPKLEYRNDGSIYENDWKII